MALGLLWKPPGVGSQDALGNLKRQLGLPGKARQGIGHTGVLDPFAEGWLLCGTDEGTKLMNPLSGLDKTYEATAIIGWTTATLDSEGEPVFATGEPAKFMRQWLDRDLDAIASDVKYFLNKKKGAAFDQTPPQFSAVHVDGKRAYDWARKGIEKDLMPKRVGILDAEHLDCERGPEGSLIWKFKVRVTSGTYVRALARDWAHELVRFPGHLTRLVRLAIGEFGLHESPHPWKLLAADDLRGIFDIHYLTVHETDRVRNFGQWQPRPHPRPCLLLGPEGQGAVAWTQAVSGKLGRVFRDDPLR